MSKHGLAAGLLALSLASSGASAQYSVFDGARLGQPISADRPQTRLLGMGHLSLVVEDENNQISLFDFAGNLAGTAEDRDGWSLESWGGRGTVEESYLVAHGGEDLRQTTRLSGGTGGTDVVYRKDARRAIGVTANFFRHAMTRRYGDVSKVRGPRAFAFYNENFGMLRLAVGAGRWSDNESVKSTDVFGVRHSSETWMYRFDAAYSLWGLDLGAQLQVDDVMIDGVSRGPSGFHQDEYRWSRPATTFSLSVLRSEGSLDAGGRMVMMKRSGREEVDISWSDRFPDNPSRVNYRITAPTFKESESATMVEGRVLLRVGESIRLGAGAAYELFDSDVVEDLSSNYPGSRRNQDLEESRLRVGGGALVSLFAGRLSIGAETHYSAVSQEVELPRGLRSNDSRRFEVRTGVEYLLPSRFAIRGGYVRGVQDENLDLPNTFYHANGYTVGLGWTPRGGMFSIDGAFRAVEASPDYEGWPDKSASRQDLMFSARFLL